MAYNNLRTGRVSQSGMVYHITTVTQNRTPCFASLDHGRKVVRQLMALQAEGRSAHAIGKAIWQANYYDHAVRQDEDLRKMARYIVANPLRANLVKQFAIIRYGMRFGWMMLCRDKSRPTELRG